MYAWICGYNIKVRAVFVKLLFLKGLRDASADVKSNLHVDNDIDIKLNQS